ncbi:unnamed protein product [Moneuplotes crassus]|uniref:Uncharacterized protein n=1 Tax=Euplotes crassus TaxID=5936 RepID=A0AAD1XZT5_EUPCR|nr:unnamed protein product [Moneuplotes crassus]
MYLDLALKEQKGSSDNIESKNRIRRMIKHFFHERDLSVLMRPTEKESDLQKLLEIKDEDLRHQFIKGLNNLRNKVFKKVQAKKLNQTFINGSMLGDLAVAYTKSLNQGSVPRIESCWDYMIEAENKKGILTAFRSMQDQLNELISDLPMNEEQLQDHKNSILNHTIRVFQEISIISKDQNLGSHIENISNKLEQEFLNVLRENREVTKSLLEAYFDKHFKPLVNKNLSLQKYKNFQDYNKEMEMFRAQFSKEMKDKGSNIELMIDQIFFRFNSLVYQEISSSNCHHVELELAATKERLRIAEEDIQRQRVEFLESRSLLESKINQLESERVHFSAQNQILNEKISLKDQEVQNVSFSWKQKWEETNENLSKIQKQFGTLEEKYQKLKEESSQKEINFVKENSEIMTQKKMAENEAKFLREQVSLKDVKIKDLQDSIMALKGRNQQPVIEVKEVPVLQEQTENDERDKQIEQYKLDLRHLNKIKENMEVTCQSLQKENIQILDENTDLSKTHRNLVDEKQENKKLTKKLLDHLKNKLIEKHESNCALKTMCSTMEESYAQIQADHNRMKEQIESYKRIEAAFEGCTSFKCKSCMRLISSANFINHQELCNSLFDIPLDITVCDFVKQSSPGERSPHYAYNISITVLNTTWCITKRFKQLWILHKKLMASFQSNQERLNEFVENTKHLEFEERVEKINDKERTKLANERMYFIRDYLAAIIDFDYVRKNLDFNKFMEIYEHFDDIQENAEVAEASSNSFVEEVSEEESQRIESLENGLTSFILKNNQ